MHLIYLANIFEQCWMLESDDDNDDVGDHCSLMNN